MSRSYKIRSFRNGQNKSGDEFINYSVTIPTHIAIKILEEMPDGVEFECELTSEGILYKPVEPNTTSENLPFTRGKRSANNVEAPAKPKATRAKPGPKPKTKAAAAKPAAPRPKAPVAKAAPVAKRGPGRPKGSTNKPKAAAEPVVARAKPGPKPKGGVPKPRAPRPVAKAK